MKFHRFARAIALVFALAAAGCSKDSPRVTAPQSQPLAVMPDSPENAVQLLRWAWVNRDTSAMHQLLTDDFEFVFAATDSAGNMFREHPWNRVDELISNLNLFRGGGSEPPATSVNVAFYPELIASRDPRPGTEYRWHRLVSTNVSMGVNTQSQSCDVAGRVNFYLVRGDSASKPPEAIAYPGLPDTTRWWLERWEDQTVGSAGGALGALNPLPIRSRTWGQLKALYR